MRGCISAFGKKEADCHTRDTFFIDFLRRDEVPSQKINFLLRPVGAQKIFTSVLKRTPYATSI